MFRLVVLTILLVASVSGESTQVVRCTSHAGDLPLNTHIEGCVNPPCILPQLQNAVMNIKFQAPRLLRSMKTLATAFLSIGIITVPITYDLEENAVTCNFLTNTFCPVLPGEVVQYTLKMFIEAMFPVGTAVNIEFRVVDENNVPVFCFRTGIRIAPPVTDGLLVTEDKS